jgi:tRNA dimethylallyltransferase
MKKLIILSGQTGVGKTDIAVKLAKSLNTEIVVIDSLQQYKEIDIASNKPMKYLNEVKFHNIDNLSLNDTQNATLFAENTRKIINDIGNHGKIPIIEGGSGFYLKNLLTGNATWRDNEMYETNIKIAKAIIKYDNDFNASLERLLRLDRSLMRNVIQLNDNYRLERRLADAITYGDGAYEYVNKVEKELRGVNKINFECFNFFFYMDKVTLNRVLERRCEEMIRSGLLREVEYLLKNDIPYENTLMNAYGIKETIKYLKDLLTTIRDRNLYLEAYHAKRSPKDKQYASIRRNFEKIFYNYILEFSTSNRKYAKRQATWYRSKDDFLWKEVTLNLDKNIIADEIVSYINTPELYKIALKNNTKPTTDITDTLKYNPKFEMLNNRQEMYTIVDQSFKIIDNVKDKLKQVEKPSEENINIELIKKYLI